MARVLVATIALTGHVAPAALVVGALVARGHTVHWYTGRKFAARVAASGATYAPPSAAADWDDTDLDAAFPALRGRRGVARIKSELRALFIAPSGAQLTDLAALADAHAPDVVLADSAHLGAALLAETRRLPWATLGISALPVPSVDTAPFGPGWQPAESWLGRARNRGLHALIHRGLFGDITRAWQDARAAAGLPRGDRTYFDVCSPDLYLQPTVPAFEYPRRDLPPQVRFIGPLVPRAPTAELPAWWPELEAAHARGTPIVLVTQGTLATDPRELLAPALRGLAALDMFVVATSPRALVDVPANARVARFIAYDQLLPRVRAMVTNAGYGGVQMALQHGVPLIAAGGSEEKPEIAARIAWSGAGIDLRTGRPRARSVRRAVERVLGEPRFTAAAQALAAAMQAHDAPAEAAALIESLAARGRV